MATYIAFLRGINVSGQKKIQMSDLKEHLESTGLSEVRTYIQSGNIVFDHTTTDKNHLKDQIEQLIKEKYGFEVKCYIITPVALRQILLDNPFINEPDKDPGKLYFVFLIDTPLPDRVKELNQFDYSPEEYKVGEASIYLYAANGFGKARLNNNFFEKKLKVAATTRNLNTVRTLLAITDRL